MKKQNIERRAFLKLGAAAAVILAHPRSILASPQKLDIPEKKLSFFNTHTGEALTTVYCAQGCYNPQALSEINYIMRDHRADEIKEIDVKLLDFLHALRRKLGAEKPFHIISGYRSPQTNALLRQKSSGVASKSLHVVGKAVDVRIPGRDLRLLRKAALSLKKGGVGYYPKSNFIHIDIGRIRSW